jgi:hypothetical protein
LLLSTGREGMTMRSLMYSSSMSSVMRRSDLSLVQGPPCQQGSIKIRPPVKS